MSGQRLRMSSMRTAAASTTCSQLSTSSSMRRWDRNEMSRSRRSRVAAAPSIGMPRASATATGTWSGVGVDRRQPHPEGTVGVVRRRADDGGERQGGLPGAAGADEGQQPYAAEELGDGVQLGVAADQRADHGGQVRRRRPVLLGAGPVRRHRDRQRSLGRGPEPPCTAAGGSLVAAAWAGTMSCWAPRVASWRSTRSCSDRSDTDGSRPRDSSRTSRVRVYTSRASAWRPLRYSASINNPASDSRVGSWATTGSRSPIDLLVPTERQCDLGAFGHRSQPELGEAGGFGGGPPLEREVAERVATPQRERVVVGLHVGRVDAAVVGCVRGGRAGGPDAVSEVERVHRRRRRWWRGTRPLRG